MTYRAFILCLFCVVIALLGNGDMPIFAQKTIAMGKKNTPQLHYKIQIAAYRNLNLAQLSPLGSIGNLFAEDAGNGIKRVIMGYYTTRTQAEALLPRVHEQGFGAAFVTPHQSIVPNDSTAIAFAPAATEETTTPIAQHSETDNTPPSASGELSPLADNEAYAIILNATDLVITQKLPDMLDWGSVFVPLNDPDANTLLGSYDTPERAWHVLDYVQANVSDKATLCIINTQTSEIVRQRATAPAKQPDNNTDTTTDNPPQSKDNNSQTDNNTATTTEAPKAETQPNPKNPCDKEEESAAATPPNTQPEPRDEAPQAEAIYKPYDSTAPKDPANTTAGSSSTNTTPEEPQSILLLPPEVIASNISEAPELPAFSRFKTYFSNYDTVKTRLTIIPYDPILDDIASTDSLQWDKNSVDTNRKLRGVYIPANLVAILDSIPQDDPKWSFYALFKYALSPMHDAYIIRAGKGEYHSDNNIYLAVYDKAVGDFTHTELISKVWGGGNSFGFMRSWITDLDQDGNHRDILTHTTEEITNGDNVSTNYTLYAKVWNNGQYLDAQIIDEPAIKQQLGIE